MTKPWTCTDLGNAIRESGKRIHDQTVSDLLVQITEMGLSRNEVRALFLRQSGKTSIAAKRIAEACALHLARSKANG